MTDKNENYKVYENNEIGSVFIADHVVEEIAAIAVLDVEGVAFNDEKNKARKLIAKKITKVLPKKIKVIIDEDIVFVDISINVKYGYNVVEVSKEVQSRIKNKISDMTGLEVRDVNVTISNVEAMN